MSALEHRGRGGGPASGAGPRTFSPHGFSLAIPLLTLDVSCVVQDRRDERIAELEAALADRDTQLAVKAERIAELERLLTVLGERLEQLARKLSQNLRSTHHPLASDPPTPRDQRGKR